MSPPLAADQAPVSLVLVVRNGARFIAQALGSVQAGRLRPAEIIVVDGDSGDDTVAIASAVPGVRVLPQTGTGIAGAYNQGIAAARFDLIAFLSHDDLWLPEKLALQYAHLAANPRVPGVLCHCEHFLEPGCDCPPGFRPELLGAPRPGWIMEALLARRSLFERIGGFDPGYRVGEDSDWFARVRDAGLELTVLPERLVKKRVHGGNATLTGTDTNAHLLRALRDSIARKRHQAAGPAPVSVIVPCYNHATYLPEALASLLAQDPRPAEIIVIDDGSTDASAAIAAGFGAPVRCLSQPRRGIAAARNAGLAAATGALIGWLDADDRWPPGSLAVRLAALDAHPEWDAVYGAAACFASPDLDPATRDRLHVPAADGPVRLAGTCLLRRGLWERVGGFDTTLAVGETLDWMARAGQAGAVFGSLDAVVLHRRIHGANTVSHTASLRADYLRVLRASIARRREAPEP